MLIVHPREMIRLRSRRAASRGTDFTARDLAIVRTRGLYQERNLQGATPSGGDIYRSSRRASKDDSVASFSAERAAGDGNSARAAGSCNWTSNIGALLVTHKQDY